MCDITIANLFTAQDLVRDFPNEYRVISIVSPSIRSSFYFSGTKDLLNLDFDDIRAEIIDLGLLRVKDKLPTVKDCQKALDFLSKGGKCLVHCQAGISRSAGMVLGHFLDKFSYIEAVDKLYEIRPQASPNNYILKLMCQILSQEEDYFDILDYISVVSKRALL